MVDENRKETVNQHKKIIRDNIKKYDKLLSNIKNDIEKKKEICTRVENIKTSQNIKLDYLNIYNKHVDELTEDQWSLYNQSYEQDQWLNFNLGYLNKEMEKQSKFNTYALDSTGTAETISGQSSPTDVIVFEPYLSTEEKHEIEKIDLKSIVEHNIAEIYDLLSIYSNSFAKDFKSIINDWNASPDDTKFNVLLKLRSFIFNNFLKSLDPDDDYMKMSWFDNYKSMPDKRTFTKVRYFIMGCTDEYALTIFSTGDIDRISVALAKAFHDLSKYGKEGGDISMVKSTFQYTLVFFRAALESRESYCDIIE